MFEDDEGFVNKFHKLFTHKYCDFNMIGCQFRNNIYDVLDDYTEGKYRVKKKGGADDRYVPKWAVRSLKSDLANRLARIPPYSA